MSMRFLKSFLFAALIACTSAAFSQPFKFVALGDMPYNIPDDYVRYERLIAEINKINPSFSIFIGDTKSGSSPCSDEYNLIIKKYFDQYSSPVIYSIGDNEWTDCHRPLAGAYDPIERLHNVRKTFFDSEMSLGKKRLQLMRQADLDPQFSKYVENSMWVKNHFLFVNLHIPGSNNNFERDESAKQEYYARNQANLSWIEKAFDRANRKHYAGIVFSYQADMFYSPNQTTDLTSGYRDTLQAFSMHAQAFKKPVLLVHGDSHRLIIDQPLKTNNQKYTLENVLRLQVMGAEHVQAVEIQVNPSALQPFSFKPILIRENMVAPRD
ncbi:hypothetical protein C2740_04860 [Polynucleobacter sp. MG-5-Ahmo-C2]|uniref:hypothetical protein n=1 Tax=Polynucleobacter sp. MG-5-Ahmo-C2 TaxID=2081051 RepID=UPI001BFD4684|nr:hypothetical protein [Polynucleobacter sp. MG-5-Ahmo-C2]QWD97704.1 hypothetical protein C2740_04860 [Polynucleobacter sp. MG-5-Ahmo-C2]